MSAPDDTTPVEPRDVVAVVVTHDSAAVLGDCLTALAAAAVPVIVVDNASGDDTLAKAQRHGARIIRAPFNEGYGRANNRGIRAAGDARWCLVVNPDLVVAPDTVRRLLQAGEADRRAAIVVPRIIEDDGRVFTHEDSLLSPAAPPLPEPAAADGADVREIAFASGACMLVRRDVFLEIGGFDPAIFLFYEDDDLCLRVRRAGRSILIADAVEVRHGRGKSAAPRPGRTRLVRYHQAWSRCYVAGKHGVSAGVVPFMLVQGIKALAGYATFNRRRIERHGGSVAGAWAALRGRPAFAHEVEG